MPIVLNGQYTNDGPGSCEEGSLKIEKTLWWDYYKCKAYTTGQECNGGQRAIAEILWGLGLDSLDCKSAYYLTIFGGGFLLLIGIV